MILAPQGASCTLVEFHHLVSSRMLDNRSLLLRPFVGRVMSVKCCCVNSSLCWIYNVAGQWYGPLKYLSKAGPQILTEQDHVQTLTE